MAASKKEKELTLYALGALGVTWYAYWLWQKSQGKDLGASQWTRGYELLTEGGHAGVIPGERWTRGDGPYDGLGSPLLIAGSSGAFLASSLPFMYPGATALAVKKIRDRKGKGKGDQIRLKRVFARILKRAKKRGYKQYVNEDSPDRTYIAKEAGSPTVLSRRYAQIVSKLDKAGLQQWRTDAAEEVLGDEIEGEGYSGLGYAPAARMYTSSRNKKKKKTRKQKRMARARRRRRMQRRKRMMRQRRLRQQRQLRRMRLPRQPSVRRGLARMRLRKRPTPKFQQQRPPLPPPTAAYAQEEEEYLPAYAQEDYAEEEGAYDYPADEYDYEESYYDDYADDGDEDYDDYEDEEEEAAGDEEYEEDEAEYDSYSGFYGADPVLAVAPVLPKAPNLAVSDELKPYLPWIFLGLGGTALVLIERGRRSKGKKK